MAKEAPMKILARGAKGMILSLLLNRAVRRMRLPCLSEENLQGG
jgi:hypothetical protein